MYGDPGAAAGAPRRPLIAALALLVAAGGVLVLLLTARTYLPFVSDDALISYRYSERLLEGRGLTYNDGERVEGYSNLLWVLAVAAGGLLSADLILVGRVAGSVGMAFTVLALVSAGGWPTWRQLIPLGAATALLAASHGLAIWSIGGLETSLLLALLAWTLAIAVHEPTPARSRTLGALLALLVLTRPDGALFTVLVSAALVLSARPSAALARELSVVAGLPAAAWLGQLAFRLFYYGEWWPNTAYVKVSLSSHHLDAGVAYLRAAAAVHWPLLLVAGIVVASARPFRHRRVLVPVCVAAGWAGYVAAIGGDIFPGWRHVMPIVVCCAVAVAAIWRFSLLARLPWGIQAAALAAACAAYAPLQRRSPENTRAREEVWEWECERPASLLCAAVGEAAPVIAADPVGCTAYFSKLPVIDMLGLNDRHIARVRPPDWGTGWIGHELGDGRYVLSRQPDLVLLCHPGGSMTGCFRSGKELVALEGFQSAYAPVTLAPAGARYPTLVWARVTSSRLGFDATGTQVRLPGLLFARNGAQSLLVDGRLTTRLPPDARVALAFVPAGGGTWTGVAMVSGGGASVDVTGADVTVTAGPQGAQLDAVTLARAGD